MRNLAGVLVALALLIPAASASTVDVLNPHITYISPQAAETTCQSRHRRGCTTLRTEFFCSCVQGPGQRWSVAPHLIVNPTVFITSQEILRHEMEHISDVRSALSEYAATLQLHAFDTEQGCRAFSDQEQSIFGHTLRGVQRITVVRRDGVRFAEKLEKR